MTGTVFDIKEFTVHDGPGGRITVFLKGCPLHCIWCHNPEGLSIEPQIMVSSGCVECKKCRQGCNHAECATFERCIHVCPNGFVSALGTVWDAQDLSNHLNTYQDLLTNGGVTFSGGEPLMQADFVAEVCKNLTLHKALQTSGYASENDFLKVLEHMDYVLFDLKLADSESHEKYTGVGNDLILNNYHTLRKSCVPFVTRIPLIPQITDTPENLSALAEIVGDGKVEFMRYNPLAGAKYKGLNMEFLYEERSPNDVELSRFSNASFI